MPTPACRATASRLASGPPALNTAFAASSTRSRLRTASVRGRRAALVKWSPISRQRSPAPLETGGTLRIWRLITPDLSVRLLPAPVAAKLTSAGPFPTIALIGAPHEHIVIDDHKWGAA